MNQIIDIELIEGEEFVQVRGYDNYFISNKGRCYNTKTKKLVGANKGDGYILVGLSEKGKCHKTYQMHTLVMEHFGPPKPEGNYEIDHINHKRDDNRIENLRWVSKSENCKNKTSIRGVQYEFFDEIPADDDEILEVTDYNEHEFEDYYYVNGYFYYDTGVSFKRLHINYDKNGSAFVCMNDTNKKRVFIFYNKFKKLYGLN